MKLFLLRLTASCLVATSAVYAHEQTSTALRGSDIMVALQGICEDGWKDGTTSTQKLWKKSGSNCANVWGLEAEANKMKNKDYPAEGGNWQDASYNECARDAVDAEVDNIEKMCLEDDSSQCLGLGNTAAELVVKKHWCTPGAGAYSTPGDPDYKAECKKAATSICEGQIAAVADSWCPTKYLSNNNLRHLQGKCEDQVDDMVPGGEME
mmetsp:Transcript_14036/g.21154  ORF Transcript_14036/g.21154 Transcript_14036/m.21154 type:complete len:209 (-) Transcript_14036:164-790(-)